MPKKISLKSSSGLWSIMILASIGVIVFFLAERSLTTSQTFRCPIFDTSDWMNSQTPGKLLIRSGIKGESLLLTMRDEFEKGDRHRAVYEFFPEAKSLRKVPDLNWDAAASPSSECVSRSGNTKDKFNISGEKLFFDKKEVPVKGSVLITAASSPSGMNVAILSADGPRMKSPMPFLGGGQNSRGQHYHQLFSGINGDPSGSVIRLQFTTEKEAYTICWSADEKYVFYTSLLSDKLTIVGTGFSSRERKP